MGITYWNPAICIVKDYLHERRDDARARTLMEKGLPLFSSKVVELIAEYKLDSWKENQKKQIRFNDYIYHSGCIFIPSMPFMKFMNI